MMLSLSTSASVSGAVPWSRLAENAAPSDCFDGGSILSCNIALQSVNFPVPHQFPSYHGFQAQGMVQLSVLELSHLSLGNCKAHLSTARMHETAGSGVTFGMTNSALPVAYRVPPGLSKTCALTQAFRPSRESRLAVHINDVEAGTGAL